MKKYRPGNFLTGIDRSYFRSIYKFIKYEFDEDFCKVQFIAYRGEQINLTNGDLSGEQGYYTWDAEMLEKYRLATSEEIKEAKNPNPKSEDDEE